MGTLKFFQFLSFSTFTSIFSNYNHWIINFWGRQIIRDVETYLTLHSWAITLELTRVSSIFSQMSSSPQKGVSIIFKGLSIISKRLSIISDLGARIWKWTIYLCDYLIGHTIRTTGQNPPIHTLFLLTHLWTQGVGGLFNSPTMHY